jgi:hypothetical protein
LKKYLRVAGSSTPISRLLIKKPELGSSKNRYSNGCRPRQPSAIGGPSAERLPEANPTHVAMERRRSDRDRREGTLSLDFSRFARQEGCCQQHPEPPDTVTCESALSHQAILSGDGQIVGSQFDANISKTTWTYYIEVGECVF